MPTNHICVLLEDVHEVIHDAAETTQPEPVVKGDRLAEAVALTMPGELEIGSPGRPHPASRHRREPAARPARFDGAMLRWKALWGRSQRDQPAPGRLMHAVGPRQLADPPGEGNPLAIMVVVLAALVTGATLWLSGARGLADLLWAAAVMLALIPLGISVARDLIRRETGVDLIALLAMVGSLILGQYLAGAVVGLMLSGGQASSATRAPERVASSPPCWQKHPTSCTATRTADSRHQTSPR